MGSIITSILAVEHPEVVEALVLVHPIYSGVPDALPQLARAAQQDPDKAPELTEAFFSKVMYTPRTPEWMKTWQLRRVLGMDPVALVGCIQACVDVYGSVMGQSEEAKMFMRKRKGDRLEVCTLPGVPEWEEEIGIVEEKDRVERMTEGTFSHMVESEVFNQFLGEWLKGRD